MAKGTIIALFILSSIAILLIGINIGKKIGISQSSPPKSENTEAVMKSADISVSPTSEIRNNPITTESAAIKYTRYEDINCGVSIDYNQEFIRQDTEQDNSVIIMEKDNPKSAIFIACEKEIPQPPLSADKIEIITIDGIKGKLYHDSSAKDGSPRDEAIFIHPFREMEVILAGFGRHFDYALKSLKFLE
jgi:hypothetical protein